MRELSVVIPARNERFLNKTVDTVLSNIRGDTEIIVVADGTWPMNPIPDNPKVVIVHFSESVGQRAATNIGVSVSRAKYIMKLDAHCSVDEGFDAKLIKDMQPDVAMVPRLYNLHAFNWVCDRCGKTTYQGPTPEPCCGQPQRMDIVWQPRLNRKSDGLRFDSDLHFQYWREYEKRPESRGQIVPVLGNLGACWMMDRNRYWELGGLDEKHGSWGQMGTEISCKTWLSGGQQLCNKNTWYSHMFRTQGGDFGFPYPLSDHQVQNARNRSKDLWINGKWDKPHRPLKWLIDKFSPVPGWESFSWT